VSDNSSSRASFYPESDEGHFSRVINARAFTRLNTLLKNTKGTIVFGGETKEESKYIAPTVVKDVKGDDSLMGEELFGPILPIVTVENVDEAIAFVNARFVLCTSRPIILRLLTYHGRSDHPLALYVFSQDPAFKSKGEISIDRIV
jgi:aldehyde dehydrogenase (NAD+)/aldehyde dehydrogenase (NAD(P)+)